MNRKLTAKSSLENLKKEAKRWLKQLRANQPPARERLRRAYPHAPAQPGLRDVHHALAQEYGMENWTALKTALADVALASGNYEERVAEFLEHSCLHYGVRPGTNTWDRSYDDHPSRWRYAARILERHPEISSYSIHAAAVCGNLAEVERILSQRPAAATEKGGPQGWEPLIFVCFGRLPIPAAGDNAVAIARALLDSGANPHRNLSDGENIFGPLTGAIGEGEFGQPPHPQAEALATLLIERGADPYDPQTMYNTSLAHDDIFWLEFLYSRSAQRNETRKWTDASPGWPPSGMLNYLLSNAVSGNRMQRAHWLLERGADAQSTNYYTHRSLHTEALLNGFADLADVLVRFGAQPQTLNGREAFQAACMRLDRDTASRLAGQHPEYLLDPEPLVQAASRDLPDIAALLLDLGMSPDVRDATNHRPLHAAAAGDSVRVGKLLIERGAQIDPEETRFNSIPLGWALYGGKHRMAQILAPVSRSPIFLVRMGNIERLRQLFAADPQLATAIESSGSLFFYLPDDEQHALQVAEFLLACGADPNARNPDGLTAAQYYEKQGLDAVADLLSIST